MSMHVDDRMGDAKSESSQRGIESDRHAHGDDDIHDHDDAYHHAHTWTDEHASRHVHGGYRDPENFTHSDNGPGDHNAEDHLPKYTSDEDRPSVSNGRRDRYRLSNGDRDAHIHPYGDLARHRDLYTNDHPHIDRNSNTYANRNTHRNNNPMKQWKEFTDKYEVVIYAVASILIIIFVVTTFNGNIFYKIGMIVFGAVITIALTPIYSKFIGAKK